MDIRAMMDVFVDDYAANYTPEVSMIFTRENSPRGKHHAMCRNGLFAETVLCHGYEKYYDMALGIVDKLCDLQNRISEEIHHSYTGKVFRCLVDGKDKDLLTARTEGGRLVRFAGNKDLIGTYQTIHITGCTTWSLVGDMR